MAKPKTSKTSPKSATKTRAATKTSDPEAVDAQNASDATTGAPDATPTTESKPAKKARAPKEDLVVFAFRLTPAERDLIHKAAGPAKASRFVRALCLHAARGDVDTVRKMVEAVRDDAS